MWMKLISKNNVKILIWLDFHCRIPYNSCLMEIDTEKNLNQKLIHFGADEDTAVLRPFYSRRSPLPHIRAQIPGRNFAEAFYSRRPYTSVYGKRAGGFIKNH